MSLEGILMVKISTNLAEKPLKSYQESANGILATNRSSPKYLGGGSLGAYWDIF